MAADAPSAKWALWIGSEQRMTDSFGSLTTDRQIALMRRLWDDCILHQTVQASGPAMDLLVDGVDEAALLLVIRKAALESLIAALVTLYSEEIAPDMAPSVFLGDPNEMDGLPFNY
jgi:hypothetical protein